MMRTVVAAAALLFGYAFAAKLQSSQQIAVSCIGDSITWGAYATDRNVTSYPARLQQNLGNGYNVTNFGRSWTTMLKNGDYSYWGTPEFNAFFSQDHVDIVIIMLGTNDGKDHNWNPYGTQYEPDYEDFVAKVRATFGNDVRILSMISPPLYATNVSDMNPYTVNVLIPPLVRRITLLNSLEVVDVFNFMGGRALSHPEYFTEGVHPNDYGYSQLGEFVAQAVLNGPPAPTPQLQDRKTYVACVGDSITEGYHATDVSHAYPEVLQTLLGPDFVVTNLGNSGKTLMKHADSPYWETNTFLQLVNLDPEPDIVTIMLGTNDGKNHNWNDSTSPQEFFDDYTELIKIVKAFKSNPVIHLMVPPPLYVENIYDGMNTTLINKVVHDLVPQIAEANGLDWISIYDLLGGDELLHAELIADGCHPSNLGYYQIALKLAQVIMQDKLNFIQNGPADITTITDA
jgi:acyl-CoA thioesterase-1